MDNNKTESAVIILPYQLGEFEQDVLRHFPGIVSSELMSSFRNGILVFHNILYELFRRGVRMRIVPQNTNLTDLADCHDLKWKKTEGGKNYYDVAINGLYRSEKKLIVILERELLYYEAVNQRYRVLIHEFAHAIWYGLLEPGERSYVTHLHYQESQLNVGNNSYRLENEREFFAESFLYYVTPPRQRQILGAYPSEKSFAIETVASDGEELRSANIRMFEWLSSKFRNIIEPELVIGKQDGYDEQRFDLWPEKGLYLPLLHSGCTNW